MPSSSLVLQDSTTTNITFALAGSTLNGAGYTVASRPLSLPLKLTTNRNIGMPTAKGNDKITLVFQDAVENSTTKVRFIGQLKIELSLPRDSAWTDTKTADLMAYAQTLFATAGVKTAIADGLDP